MLGNKVRYDGGHKLDRFLVDTLGKYVSFYPVCPEVECGLGIPRQSMRLVGTMENPRLMTQENGVDYTEKMIKWSRKRVKELESENLHGFIFKSKSPSSGMERIRVYRYDKTGYVGTRAGIFAQIFMDHFPLLPVEEDGRLHDIGLRENFIEQIFVFKRWRQSVNSMKTVGDLVSFHTGHKLLIMAHSVKYYREIGRLVANAKKIPWQELITMYEKSLIEAMRLKTTVKKHTNVLHHMMGYFKKMLSREEKQELADIIENYRKEYYPLIVPVTLINHYVRKYGEEYLARQFYLNPHPVELKLRNHA